MDVLHRFSPFNSRASMTIKDIVPQLQKQPKAEEGLSWRHFQVWVLSNEPLYDTRETHKNFKTIVGRNTACLDWKGKIIQCKKQLEVGWGNDWKLRASVHGNSRQTQRVELRVKKNHSRAMSPNQGNADVCPVRFENWYGSVTPILSVFFLCESVCLQWLSFTYPTVSWVGGGAWIT